MSAPSPWPRALLITLVLVPPLFLLFMIQHAAITVPFWDHVELGRMLVRHEDGRFQWSELWSGHNHSRPLTLRAVFLVNALLTGWDVRSEFFYVYAAIYGAFAVAAVSLWKAAKGASTTQRLALLAVLSLLAFSPVGHQNHWWSMMLQLDLAHVFVLGAFFPVAFAPRSPAANVLGAAACWLATYTLTNGLVAFVTLAALAHTRLNNKGQTPIIHTSALSWFWLANLAVVLPVYCFGLPETRSATLPTLAQMVAFALAYLGTPLAGLVWFPFTQHFDLPPGVTGRNAAAGTVLVATWVACVWCARHRLLSRRPGTVVMAGFGAFAIGCAVMTAWARAAFDEYGVANANASKYALFGGYLLLGLLFGAADAIAVRGSLALPLLTSPRRKWIAFAACALAALVSYGRSTGVYHKAHKFDRHLTRAWLGPDTDANLEILYPHAAVVRELRNDLRRLGLGPFRGRK